MTPRPLSLSGTGDATGELVAVGLAMEADMPEGGLAGKIALARRGIISFQEKVDNLTEAGAVGVVIYNNLLGNFQGVLSTRAQVPVVSVSQSHGRALEELVQTGSVTATMSVIMQTVESQNVLAETKWSGGPVVVVGGHYDTLPEISGANDNSSGTAVVLSLAKALAGRRLPFDLKFVALGSEELGSIGSAHYVDALSAEGLERAVAMLNFDALASGPQVGILGGQ